MLSDSVLAQPENANAPKRSSRQRIQRDLAERKFMKPGARG